MILCPNKKQPFSQDTFSSFKLSSCQHFKPRELKDTFCNIKRMWWIFTFPKIYLEFFLFSQNLLAFHNFNWLLYWNHIETFSICLLIQLLTACFSYLHGQSSISTPYSSLPEINHIMTFCNSEYPLGKHLHCLAGILFMPFLLLVGRKRFWHGREKLLKFHPGEFSFAQISSFPPTIETSLEHPEDKWSHG